MASLCIAPLLGGFADIAAEAAGDAGQELSRSPQYDASDQCDDKATHCNHVCRDSHVITPALSYRHALRVCPVDDVPT